jgi:hypothetical protein
MIGVEPTWITPPDPKSGASANFATSGILDGKGKDFVENMEGKSEYLQRQVSWVLFTPKYN